MCGIAGFISDKFTNKEELSQIAHNMGLAIQNRGPDSAGVWTCENTGVAFSHRRLSIIDPSMAGHQPMVSNNQRFILGYNGEIYNADDLKQAILKEKNIEFRGHSDTEAILEHCALFGVQQTSKKLIGMFAFSLWDKKTQTLYLVRDRLGIKPLYWGKFDNSFIFSSEIKGMRPHPDFKVEINPDSVAAYLRTSYVPTPFSIYKNIHKLPPGHILTLQKNMGPELEAYWALDNMVKHPCNKYRGHGEGEILDHLEDLLKDAVGRRMIADVPLGAFLSGGVDSSLVTSLMQAQSSSKVKTFSIGFSDKKFNEAEQAAEVARHLGTDHTELYVTPKHIRDIIPQMPLVYDEPFADSSQLPTWLISRLTRQHITVALSGDGGDELFAGYTRYQVAHKLAHSLFLQPRPLRKFEAALIQSISPTAWNKIGQLVPDRFRPTLFGDKLHKLASVMEGDKSTFYHRLTSHWGDPEKVARMGKEQKSEIWGTFLYDSIANFTQQMQYADILTYLPDDILTKVDRSSMDVSLEVRVPLLDHRLVEFAWNLPQELHLKNGQGKYLLRKILDKYVPRELIERPKMGFAVPIGNWLRGSLNEWANEVLSPDNLNKYGFVNTDHVQMRWAEHQSGKRAWNDGLWNIIMLHTWAEQWHS